MESKLTEAVLSLASALVGCRSDSSGCAAPQALLAKRFAALGFSTETVTVSGVPNLWACSRGTGPLFAFSGHTDVVPSGPVEQWKFPPFEPTVHDGYLWGRGVADMKAPVAAFVVALESFLKDNPQPGFRVGFLIAGDEETTSLGTPALLDLLRARGEKIDFCLVGEPTSKSVLGDTIKVGRRGSLTGKVTITGVQAHVAYPLTAKNPNHEAARIAAKLLAANLDTGLPPAPPSGTDEGWPESSLQITDLHGGIGANNVVPGECSLVFNVRFRSPHTKDSLIKILAPLLKGEVCKTEVVWIDGAVPYDSKPGKLREAVCRSIREVLAQEPRVTRDGGTSDGRFVAHEGVEVVEFGPTNGTIHKTDERLQVEELVRLVGVYRRILETFAGKC